MPRQLVWQAQERDQDRADKAHSRARPVTSMVRALALRPVQRLHRNDCSGAEGRNDGKPVRPFAVVLQVAGANTALQEPR
jgi:hypothetical protein